MLEDNKYITTESLHDGNLVVMTAKDFSNPAVDAWAEQVKAYKDSRGVSPTRYIVYDFSQVNVGISSYARQRTIELAEADRQATGRVAIVLSTDTITRHVFNMFINTFSRRRQPYLTVKLFSDRAEAIQWVEESMP